MLINLQIENVAVIDKTQADFTKGFNVLTGETGAGKSMIIDSINMLMGARTSKELIRYGEKTAACRGLFSVSPYVLKQLEAFGVSVQDNEVLLSREISVDGRSICRINGQIVTASILRDVGQCLINIHGQHDNQALLAPTKHIEFLDSFAGEHISALLDEYKLVYHKILALRKKRSALNMDEAQKQFTQDMLTHQIAEIEKGKIKVGEKERLESKLQIITNSESLSQVTGSAFDSLYEGDEAACDKVQAALRALTTAIIYDDSLTAIYNRLNDVSYELTDIAETLGDYKQKLDFDPNLLAKIDNRLDIIKSLCRKYGGDEAAVLEFYNDASEKLYSIEKSEDAIGDITKEIDSNTKILKNLAQSISGIRHECAGRLMQEIEAALADLDMPKTRFVVSISTSEKEYYSTGKDKVEFLISANPGEPPKPMTKIASGGELSRIMLAIKSVLTDEEVKTLIFDEIDTGVSGRAAQKIAQKMAQISTNKQIICITHLAQIAAMADSHFLIEKSSSDNKSYTSVTHLENDARTHEIARITSGGNITELALTHSKELIESAGKCKDGIA